MTSKPGLILQHGPDGPPARLAEWLRERGLAFVAHPVWEEPIPDPDEFSFVVSLGSIHSAAAHEPPWIPREIEVLRAAIENDTPVLGLCFGGQALSVALGGGTDPLDRPEVGWIAVETVDESVPSGPWLLYHSEQLRIPPGARELARSPAGPAVFTIGPHMGTQFHPEADAALVDLWARKDRELQRIGLTADDLARQSAAHSQPAREQAFRLFDTWLEGAADGA